MCFTPGGGKTTVLSVIVAYSTVGPCRAYSTYFCKLQSAVADSNFSTLVKYSSCSHCRAVI